MNYQINLLLLFVTLELAKVPGGWSSPIRGRFQIPRTTSSENGRGKNKQALDATPRLERYRRRQS